MFFSKLIEIEPIMKKAVIHYTNCGYQFRWNFTFKFVSFFSFAYSTSPGSYIQPSDKLKSF